MYKKDDKLLNLFCDVYRYKDDLVFFYDYYNDSIRMVNMFNCKKLIRKLLHQLREDAEFVALIERESLMSLKEFRIGRFGPNITCDEHKRKHQKYINNKNRMKYV